MTRAEKNDFATKLWLGVVASILIFPPAGIIIGIPLGLIFSLMLWAN
jgi:hypothetical protein